MKLEEYKNLIQANNCYQFGYITSRMEVIRRLLVTFEDKRIPKEVLAVIDFQGKRDVEDYCSFEGEDESFGRLCQKAWDALGGRDTGSSSGNMCNYKFLSEIILFVSELKKEAVIKEKQSKIAQLEAQVNKLKQELEQ